MNSNANNNNELLLVCSKLLSRAARTYIAADVLSRVNETLTLNFIPETHQATHCGDFNVQNEGDSVVVLFPSEDGRMIALAYLSFEIFDGVEVSASVSCANKAKMQPEDTNPKPKPHETQGPITTTPSSPPQGPHQGPPGVVKITCVTPNITENHTEQELKEAINDILRRHLGSATNVDTLAKSCQHLNLEKSKGFAKVNFSSVASSLVAIPLLNNCELFPGLVVSAKSLATPAAVPAVITAIPPDAVVPIQPFVDSRPNYFDKTMHFFFDATNFFFPIKREDRFDIKELMETLCCGGRSIGGKYANGSVEPPEQLSNASGASNDYIPAPWWQRILQHESAHGISGPAESWVIRKEIRPKGFPESMVDDCIVAQIYRTLNVNKDVQNGVLVVISGDGNNSKGIVSIQAAIADALLYYPSWKVHLWSWRGHCNQLYVEYTKNPNLVDRFYLNYFDDFPKIIPGRNSSSSINPNANINSYINSNSNSNSNPNRKFNVPPPPQTGRRSTGGDEVVARSGDSSRDNSRNSSPSSSSSSESLISTEEMAEIIKNCPGYRVITKYHDEEGQQCVLKLKVGDTVYIEKYAFHESFSVGYDTRGKRGYIVTANIERL